jgi:hypothetical protein
VATIQDYNESSKRQNLKFHNKLDIREEMHTSNSSLLLRLTLPHRSVATCKEHYHHHPPKKEEIPVLVVRIKSHFLCHKLIMLTVIEDLQCMKLQIVNASQPGQPSSSKRQCSDFTTKWQKIMLRHNALLLNYIPIGYILSHLP